MNVHAPSAPRGYGIEILPLQGRVTIRHNGRVLASSTQAKVMFETRLAPAIYFPPQDILANLTDPTTLQTFCPFKGTAGYRDLILDDQHIQNAVWMYDTPMQEAVEICAILFQLTQHSRLPAIGEVFQKDIVALQQTQNLPWKPRPQFAQDPRQ